MLNGVFIGLDKAITKLERIKKETPSALSKALTSTAFEVRKEERAEMPRVFDKPTPYVLNSLFVWPATPASLKAEVGFKDTGGKDTPAANILGPHIRGGSRKYKRSEKLLTNRGILLDGRYWVPGAGVKRDRFGNVGGGTITQILSALGAQSDRYQNTTARSRRRNKKLPKFFAIRKPGRNLVPGVWEKQGLNVKPILLFVKKPQYRANRFQFYAVGRTTAQKVWPVKFAEAMKKVMR